jgi:hypothetical protein
VWYACHLVERDKNLSTRGFRVPRRPAVQHFRRKEPHMGKGNNSQKNDKKNKKAKKGSKKQEIKSTMKK